MHCYELIGLNGLVDVVGLVEKGETDLEYLMYYLDSHGINLEYVPSWLGSRIATIVENGFEGKDTGVFHVTQSIKVVKTIYTNKYTGNDLYVRDQGQWILVRDFIKLYDAIRDAITE